MERCEYKIEGKVVLSLWLDSLSNVNPILVTHEIGHWVLKLQGFQGFIYQPKKHSDIEILLNSMAHHPPLYALQRSFGHEPQETKGRQSWTRNALLLADDLINCSEAYRTHLKKIVSKKHPLTTKLLEKILILPPYYNLLNPDQNLKFSKKVILDLKLGDGWYEIDEVKTLISMVDQAQSNKI
jgi:hypothetical protein